MKLLITPLAALMTVGCAGEDNLSATTGVGSAAVFHTENEAKPLPLVGKAVIVCFMAL
jgi:hypothetical protein